MPICKHFPPSTKVHSYCLLGGGLLCRGGVAIVGCQLLNLHDQRLVHLADAHRHLLLRHTKLPAPLRAKGSRTDLSSSRVAEVDGEDHLSPVNSQRHLHRDVDKIQHTAREECTKPTLVSYLNSCFLVDSGGVGRNLAAQVSHNRVHTPILHGVLCDTELSPVLEAEVGSQAVEGSLGGRKIKVISQSIT
jgi:hypothetical protein